jgi:cation:H+ antiporter
LLGLTLTDGSISINESVGFIGILMLFMYVLSKFEEVSETGTSEPSEFTKSLFLSLVGLVGLIAGSNISIIYAENTAILLGISELIIGLTIIALGTSLPELAATIVALGKGKHQMVVGNIIGSNVFNLVFVIPIIGFFGTIQLNSIVLERDFIVLSVLSAIFIALTYALAKLRFNRSAFIFAGIILIASYFLYIGLLAGVI